MKNPKIGIIFILYKTPREEVKRLESEIKALKFKKYKIYFIDNTSDNSGYAGGINEGIKKALVADLVPQEIAADLKKYYRSPVQRGKKEV